MYKRQVVEATKIALSGKRFTRNLCIYEDSMIPGLSRLVEAIHRGGALAAIQLNHGGRECKAEIIGRCV